MTKNTQKLKKTHTPKKNQHKWSNILFFKQFRIKLIQKHLQIAFPLFIYRGAFTDVSVALPKPKGHTVRQHVSMWL